MAEVPDGPDKEADERRRLIDLYRETGNENFLRAAICLKREGRILDLADARMFGRPVAEIAPHVARYATKLKLGRPAQINYPELWPYYSVMHEAMSLGQAHSRNGAAAFAVKKLGRGKFQSEEAAIDYLRKDRRFLEWRSTQERAARVSKTIEISRRSLEVISLAALPEVQALRALFEHATSAADTLAKRVDAVFQAAAESSAQFQLTLEKLRAPKQNFGSAPRRATGRKSRVFKSSTPLRWL